MFGVICNVLTGQRNMVGVSEIIGANYYQKRKHGSPKWWQLPTLFSWTSTELTLFIRPRGVLCTTGTSVRLTTT